MNKHAYIKSLEQELKACHVEEPQDILQEYEEHFNYKLQDGYSEEEIAAKLAPPKEIAQQFAGIDATKSAGKGEHKKSGRILIKTSLVFLDIFVASFFLVLFSLVLSVGSFALAFLAIGVALPFMISFGVVIPYMPYICRLFLGIAFLALAVMAAMATQYCWRFTVQLLRAYARWHRNACGAGLPPLPKYPQTPAPTRRRRRTVLTISAILFGVFLFVGLITMFGMAGSAEPWHVWRWWQ